MEPCDTRMAEMLFHDARPGGKAIRRGENGEPGGFADRCARALWSRAMTAARPPLRIVVVGCGIAGMAAAILLARQGHRVEVVERFAAPGPVGSGLLLQPLGLAVLDRLGVGATVRAAGARIERLYGLVHPSGRRILDVGYGEIGTGLSGLGIHRATLFGALHEAMRAAGATVVPGTSVSGVARAADGRPMAVTAGGADAPADLLVDASGARSVPPRRRRA